MDSRNRRRVPRALSISDMTLGPALGLILLGALTTSAPAAAEGRAGDPSRAVASVGTESGAQSGSRKDESQKKRADETKSAAASTSTPAKPADNGADEKPVEEVRRSIVVTAQDPGLATERRVAGRDLQERDTRDLVEALRDEPALNATRRGSINLDPSVRGLQESQVAAFVDGTRTFAAGPARMDSDLSHVGPDAVESVQVVKGPYALTWGAGALSAIRVETFRPPFRQDGAGGGWGGRVDGSWGENGSVGDGGATVYRSSERSRFVLSLDGRNGNDYRAGDGSTVPGDYRSESAHWRLGFRPSGNTTVEYSGGYQGQHDLDYPGRILDASYFFTNSHAVDLDWQAPSTSAGPGTGGRVLRGVHAQVYSNEKRHRMNNDEKPTALPMPGRVPPFGLDVDLPTHADTRGASVHADLAAAGLRWRVGGDVYDLKQDAHRTVSRRDTGAVLFQDIVWPDAEIVDGGAYGQGIWRRDAVELAGTVRVDRVDASAGTLSEFFRENTTGNPDRTETNLSAALSGRWNLSDIWVLTAGLGRAVRTASVLERYSDRFPSTRFQVAAELLGDPSLKPEASQEIDLGSEVYLGSGGGISTVASVDLYYRRIEDYITVVPDPSVPRRLPLSPPTVYRYINGDGATFWGGEASLHGDRPLGRSGQTLGWRATASYVRGRDETFDEPAFGVPPLDVRTGLRWTAAGERGWIDGSVDWVDDQTRVATSRLEQPTDGHTTVDLAAGWRAARGVTIRVGVENLFDQAYADHLTSLDPFAGERVLEPGRRVSVGLSYQF